MRLLILIVVVGLIVAAWAFVKRFADAYERDAIRDFDASITAAGSVDAKQQVIVDNLVRIIRRLATLNRSTIFMLIVALVAGAGCLAWLEDITDRQGSEIARSCNADLEFRRLIDAQRTEDIRIRQAQRDGLADIIANESTETRAIEGFDELPASVQAFLENLLVAELADAQARLEAIDEDLARLRSQVDEIRAFNLEQNCPG